MITLMINGFLDEGCSIQFAPFYFSPVFGMASPSYAQLTIHPIYFIYYSPALAQRLLSDLL